MSITLKLSYNQKEVIPGLEVWYNNLLASRNPIHSKVSTKILDITRDKKDERYINSIRKVEITIELKTGFLILKGHLSCSYARPFGGEFYIIDYKEIPNGIFHTQGGVPVYLSFDNNNPVSIDTMRQFLDTLIMDNNFVFNVSQFSEFMEVFKFYKQLSDEINNSATYEIKNCSQPYYFIPIDVKELYDDTSSLKSQYHNLTQVFDGDNIIKGYKVDDYIYELFDNKLKDKTLRLVDINVACKEDATKRIQRMKENIFVSDFKTINESNIKSIHDVEYVNIIRQKDGLLLSIISDKQLSESYLNLYDMGQKIKIESIDNSLKLINRGTTEASMSMIEYLIGDKVMPSNTGRAINHSDFIQYALGINPNLKSYIKDLNDSQKIAFLKAVDGSPVTLIKGPPGTGKTHVINAITQYITKELHEKVVISSQTHVAIDNVLDKLMENYDLVVPNRITNRRNKYSLEEIDRTLYKTWGSKINDYLAKIDDYQLRDKVMSDLLKFKGVEEIQYSRNMKEDFHVIGATTTTSAISGKKGLELLKDYKWLIIDEVSKSPITEVLRYLPYVEKIILVGDDYQLAPLLEFSKEDVKHLPSYNDDLFDKLEAIYEQSVFSKTIRKAESSNRLIVLDENYRSLKTVLDCYNIFYNGRLKNMREKVNSNVVQFNSNGILNNDNNTYFIEVLGSTEQDDPRSHSRFNVQESIATTIVLKDILNSLVNPQTVSLAIIFPYAAQISYFTKNNIELINQAKKRLKSFELDTVDAFQGRETDIVLVNTVVTRTDKSNFLKDFRRINVSMSRSRDKLVIFGSRNIEKIEMGSPDGGYQKYFKLIIDGIRKNGSMVEISTEGVVTVNDNNSSSKFA